MGANSVNRYNLDNFEAVFREFLITDGVSPLTLKNYLSDLRHFLGWFMLHLKSQGLSLNEAEDATPAALDTLLDVKAVTAYKTYLEANKLPVKTVNRRLSTLRKFCSLAIHQGWMKENPAKQVPNVGVTGDEAPAKAAIAPAPASRQQAVTVNTLIREYSQHLRLEKKSEKEISLTTDDIEEFFNVINS